jgi:hypothetical protein
MMTADITYFEQLVRALDYGRIAAAQGAVRADHLPALVDLYWRLHAWPQRAAVIHLMRDLINPRTRPIMVNFLSARSDEMEEYIEQAKIIALCHLGDNLNLYARYDAHRDLIEPTACQYLADFCS